MHKWYCYVLWATVGRKFHVGLTRELEKRVAQHNADISKWSRRFVGSWDLVWNKEFDSIPEARQCQTVLEQNKGSSAFFELTGLNQADFSPDC